MSVWARWFSSRRRRPTSRSRPRRLWWSCLCCLRCSVRSLIRRVSIATCTSGEPVSFSTVAYWVMICFFRALSSATASLLVPVTCGPRSGSRGQRSHSSGSPTNTHATSAARTAAGPARQRCSRRVGPLQDLAGALDVAGHGGHQVLDAVEGGHGPQPGEELDADVLAVEVAVVVQDVGLDHPPAALERRVAAHGDRRGEALL